MTTMPESSAGLNKGMRMPDIYCLLSVNVRSHDRPGIIHFPRLSCCVSADRIFICSSACKMLVSKLPHLESLKYDFQ